MKIILTAILYFALANGISLSASAQSREFIEVELYDYGWESDMAVLDNVAIQLQNEEKSLGYLIIYGSKRNRMGEVKRRMQCLKDYLIERRGISAGRVIVVDGGYRDKMMLEAWIAPQGERAPAPAPTISPKGIKLKKGKIRYGCTMV